MILYVIWKKYFALPQLSVALVRISLVFILAVGISLGTFVVERSQYFGFSSGQAQAALSSSCRKALRRWKRRKHWGAFAQSRSGACGFSWSTSSRKSAVSDALRECRKRSKGCKVVSVLKPVRVRTPAGKGGRPVGACARALKKWKTRPGYRAFYSAERGRSCNTTWNHRTVDAAIAGAKEACEGSNGCKLYDIGAPEGIIKRWQENLTVLGLYTKAIDGDFGGGSKASLRKFAQLAGIKNVYSDETFSRLLWATRIKTELGLPVKRSIIEAADVSNLTDWVKLRTKTIREQELRPEPAPEKKDVVVAGAATTKEKLVPISMSRPAKVVEWTFKENERDSFEANSSGRCLLNMGQVEFSRYGSSKERTLALTSTILKTGTGKVGSGNEEVEWLVDGKMVQRSSILDLPKHGRHISILNDKEFFTVLATGGRLQLKLNGQADASYSLQEGSLALVKYIRCLQR